MQISKESLYRFNAKKTDVQIHHIFDNSSEKCHPNEGKNIQPDDAADYRNGYGRKNRYGA